MCRDMLTDMTTDTPTLYIMCGFPFSGKSIFSKDVAVKTSIVRVSFDETWQLLGEKVSDISYESVMVYIEKQITEELKKGVSVIYDSTNLKADHRMSLVYLAEKAGAQALIVYIPTTQEETLRRRDISAQDGTHHVVDQENIDKSFEHLEVPADAVVLTSEEDKERFLEELMSVFAR